MTKHTIKSRITENPYFFYSYALFLVIGFFILIFTDKGYVNILFNDYRNTQLDLFFIYSSKMGEGLYFSIILVILTLSRFRYLVLGLSVYLGSGLISQILKNIFDIDRPKIFFGDSGLATFVENVEIYSHLSFPSGHSTSGFAIFLFLSVITKNKKYGLLFLLCAVFVATSRVFLMQHFFIDIYFGSLIGVFFTIIFLNLFENSERIKKSNWYNFSMLDKIKGHNKQQK